MNEETHELSDPSLIEKQAIAWFTRMNGKPSEKDRNDFATWLDASSDHGDAFIEIRSLWQGVGPSSYRPAEQLTGDLAKHLKTIEKMRADKKMRRTGGIMIGCLAVFFAGSWFWLERPIQLQDWGADIVTARGERREIMLQDGSRVLLDAQTALDVDIADGVRQVWVRHGSAFFDVTHREVPFVVTAGNGEIRVLGTQFDVSTNDHGKVEVTLATGSIGLHFAGEPEPRIMKPGERIDYDADGVGTVQTVHVDDEMAWHSGRYIFNNEPLADVVARLERYRNGRIVILNPSLGAQMVSGNIPLDDPDEALGAIQASVGFRLNRIGTLVLIGP